MKIILLSVLLATNLSFAEDKTSTKDTDQNQDHVQMHERMAKAHQQAADCLKAGKPPEECRKDFHEMCKEADGSNQCGPWMMHHKKGRKGQ